MALCPEAAQRAAMDDAEFWEYVLLGGPPAGHDYDPDDDPGAPPADEVASDPCPICHAVGACGYDAAGLPMIHAIPADPEE